MGGGNSPLPPQDSVATTFRNLSIRPSTPSLPCRALSLNSVPQVRKPTTHAFLSQEGTHGWGRLSPFGRFSLLDTPGVEPFLSAMQHRSTANNGRPGGAAPSGMARGGSSASTPVTFSTHVAPSAPRPPHTSPRAPRHALHAPPPRPPRSIQQRCLLRHASAKVKYDSVRSASSASLARPSSLSSSSPEVVHWLSSTAITLSRGSSTLAARPPRARAVTRCQSHVGANMTLAADTLLGCRLQLHFGI